MILLMVPGFWMFIGGAMFVPAYGDVAGGIAIIGAALMLVGAVAH